jgi:hypothetical protein
MPINPYMQEQFDAASSPRQPLWALLRAVDDAGGLDAVDPALRRDFAKYDAMIDSEHQAHMDRLHGNLVERDAEITNDAGEAMRQVHDVRLALANGELDARSARGELRDLAAMHASMTERHEAIDADFEREAQRAAQTAADWQAERISRGLLPPKSLPSLYELTH